MLTLLGTTLSQCSAFTNFTPVLTLPLVGNGCVNDFSRTLSAHVWQSIIPRESVNVFSGGTEGVLSPHVTFIVQHPHPTGLVACVGRTRALEPQEIGTTEHARQVSLK